MTGKERLTLGIVILVFAAVMVAIFWDYIQYLAHKGKKAVTGGTGTGGTGSGSNPSSSIDDPGKLDGNKLLKKGMYDVPEIGALQHLLNMVDPVNLISEDNDFGPKTESKLKKYNNGSGSITLNQAISQIQAALNALYGSSNNSSATDPVFQNILSKLN